jgi:transcriptional regulator with XRE-family HTH domain
MRGVSNGQHRPGFAAWLKYERERLGYSQKQVGAEALGVGQGAISHYEHGRVPTLEAIIRLSEYFFERGGECY